MIDREDAGLFADRAEQIEAIFAVERARAHCPAHPEIELGEHLCPHCNPVPVRRRTMRRKPGARPWGRRSRY